MLEARKIGLAGIAKIEASKANQGIIPKSEQKIACNNR
jgi:hypothetical protein